MIFEAVFGGGGRGGRKGRGEVGVTGRGSQIKTKKRAYIEQKKCCNAKTD